MDWVDALHDTPDLSEEVEVLSYCPVFTGTFSLVYKGEMKNTHELVAIKVLKSIRGTGLSTMRRKINRERKIWSSVKHPNILPLYGFAEDHPLFQPFGAFISPWRRNGDLEEFLSNDGKETPIEERIQLWKDIVAGVHYLHSHSPVIIHGDLKPRNILINDAGQPQICDFGLVRVYLQEGHSGMTTASPYFGTDRYLAWELAISDGDEMPTTASDIHATGCIGLEVIFLEKPYSSCGKRRILDEIRAGKPPATLPSHPSSAVTPFFKILWDVVSWCWDQDPLERPHAHVLFTRLQQLCYLLPNNPEALTREIPRDICLALSSTNNAPFTCSLYVGNSPCSKVFVRMDRFRHHLQGHLRITPYFCASRAPPSTACGAKFSSVVAMDTHIRNKIPMSCVCGITLYPKNMSRHQITCPGSASSFTGGSVTRAKENSEGERSSGNDSEEDTDKGYRAARHSLDSAIL